MPQPLEIFKAVLGVTVLAILALGWVSRRHPEISWLRPFDLSRGLTPKQKERLHRTQEVTAGIQFILLGVVLPLGYVALKVMFFNDFPPGEVAVVALCSLLCIGLGGYAVTKSLRR